MKIPFSTGLTWGRKPYRTLVNRTWNNLPEPIKKANNSNSFKNKIKNPYLNQQSDTTVIVDKKYYL